MKKIFTLSLIAFLLNTNLNAQLQTEYFKFYNDNFIDTLSRANDLIGLVNGGFAIATLQNRPGKINYSVNVDWINTEGTILSSFDLDPIGTSTVAKLSQAPDSSIWLVYNIRETEPTVRERTRIVQFSPNLDSILSETILDVVPDLEIPIGILATDSLLIVLSVSLVGIENSAFVEFDYVLTTVDMNTLTIRHQVDDAFPRGSYSDFRAINILQVEPDRIGLGLITRDSAKFRKDFLIREFKVNDLSQTDEYKPRGIGGFNFSSNLVYVPNVDAYATIDGGLNTYLLKRGTGHNPIVDTIFAPRGLRGSNNRLNYLNNSLYAVGRNAYRIDFTHDALDTIVVLENYENTYRLSEPDLDGNILAVNTFSNSSLGIRAITYVDSTASFADTLDLTGRSSGRGVFSYYGAFSIPSFKGTETPLLSLKQTGEVGGSRPTWGMEFVNSKTGDRNGQILSSYEIGKYASDISSANELSQLIRVTNGYMGFVNQRDRVSFFRFDDSLKVLQASELGAGVAEFNPAPRFLADGSQKVTPTSYGILGVVMGAVFDDGFYGYRPYLFACDTSFQVKIASRIDTISFYPTEPFYVNADSLDRIYSVGLKASDDNIFRKSNTVIIIGHESDASIRFLKKVDLPKNTDTSIENVVLSNDQSELLISGTYLDDAENGYFIRVNTENGNIIELKIVEPEDLGYELGRIITYQALYDNKSNIVMALVGSELKPLAYNDYEIRTIQIDSTGKILADEVIYNISYILPEVEHFTRIGKDLYLSGEIKSLSGIEKHAFIIKLNSGTQANPQKEPLVAFRKLEFEAYPNPTVDQITVIWRSNKAGNYLIQLYDGMGRPVRKWSGTQMAGKTQTDLTLGDLPKGHYIIRLDNEDGFLLWPILKR